MRRQLLLATAVLTVAASLSTPSADAVIGGTTADPPPWMVAVSSPGILLRPSGQFCGGILVRPDKVVTAAHCANLFKLTPGLLRGIFGRADLHGKDGETVSVKKIWVHPGFKETKFMGDTVEHNDVAVLTLSRAVNRATLPVIDAGSAYPAGAPADVLGWGTTSESDKSNAVLRKAVVPIVADATCTTSYGGSFDAGMVCAGTTQADTCEYDSGGPLILNGKLAGLTSWAHGCARAGFPGVYTRLTAFSLPL